MSISLASPYPTEAAQLVNVLVDAYRIFHSTRQGPSSSEDGGALNVSVLEIATPAARPSAPQKARVLALALVLGILLGGALSLLKGLMPASQELLL